MERLEATITGQVQGVTYRDFACTTARKLGLTGFVENVRGGAVHLIAEGAHEKLEALHAHLYEGPLFAHVEKVEVLWGTATGEYHSFEIRYN